MTPAKMTPEREFANKVAARFNESIAKMVTEQGGQITIAPIAESFYRFIAECLAAYRATQEEDAGKMTAEKWITRVSRILAGKYACTHEQIIYNIIAEAYHQYRATKDEAELISTTVYNHAEHTQTIVPEFCRHGIKIKSDVACGNCEAEYRASVGVEGDPICITCRCPQSVHRPIFARDSAKPLSLEPARWICPEPPCSSAIRSSKGWRKSAVLEGVEPKLPAFVRLTLEKAHLWLLRKPEPGFDEWRDLEDALHTILMKQAGLGEGREGEND